MLRTTLQADKDAQPFIRSIGRIARSPDHLKVSLLLPLVAIVVLLIPTRVGGAAVAIGADLYLLAMLWSATVESSNGQPTTLSLPERETAVASLPLLFATLVVAFAAIYRIEERLSPWAAAYASLVRFATFSYDVALPSQWKLALAMVGQALSAIVLLICALPLLVSRLADLDKQGFIAKSGSSVTVTIDRPEDFQIKSAKLNEDGIAIEIVPAGTPTAAET